MTLDAIVLLGCRIGTGGRLHGAARRRADRAAKLWRQGVAPLLVVSGGRLWRGVREADALGEYLLGAGVAKSALVLEKAAGCTRENARGVADLLFARGATHVGVVTCDWHLRRAAAAFRRVGFDVTGFPARSPRASLGTRLLRRGREQLGSMLDRTAFGGTCAR